MTKMQIKKKVYEAYCNHGVATACDEANKHNQVKYEYCKACENDMPAIDHECLICGQNTVSQTKELFTQGEWSKGKNTSSTEWMHVYANGKPIARALTINKRGEREAGDFAEEEANAALIAQAKNMYYRLKDVAQRLHYFQSDAEMSDQDREIIHSIQSSIDETLQKATPQQ